MSDTLIVSYIQSDVVWENAAQNRINFEQQILKLQEATNLIVLPEMFTTGFAMQPKNLAESMNGETVKWMVQMAKKSNAAICGSIIISENNRYYNRFLFVSPSGNIKQYDKRHLFTLAGEHHSYKAGNKKVIITYKGWKICPMVCYDLRFPVWSRNTTDYDILVYVANWPQPRIVAWNTLLKARAIENMSYVIGVNRVGTDPNGNNYNGNSVVLDPIGNVVSPIAENIETCQTVTLSKSDLITTRKKFNFLNDQDTFTLT